jgi:methylenetetrahydrofolate dehydrogenase (NADP+)/methenyltetrahydrofolate cyclohydrolase
VVDPGAQAGPEFGWYTRHADVLIVAADIPGLIRAEHVKEGAIVIDAGATAASAGDGPVVGDVVFAEVASRARAVIAGPTAFDQVRAAALIGNVVRAARLSAGVGTELVGSRP